MGLPYLMFFIVALGVGAGFQLLTSMLFPDTSRIRRRMAAEFKDKGEVPRSALFKNLDRLSVDPTTGGISDLGMAEMPGSLVPVEKGFWARLRTTLEQADLSWSVAYLFAVLLGSAVALGAAGTYVKGPVLGVLGAAAGAAWPLVYIHWRRNRRQEKFLIQLPAAFDLMARVMRAGHSVSQALQAVVDTMDQPVAGEFAQCQKQQNLGLRAEITFQDLARRTGIVEMRIFVMALLIQRQVGGNLSEVLERLAMLIRSRLRLKGQVQTLTAEGRLQGLTLLVLPFVMFGVMLTINAEYALVLFEQIPLLIAMGISMLIGMLWIRRIVNFEV
jgi:tight adherence protein B